MNVYYHINYWQEYMQSLGILNARDRVTNCYAHQGEDDNSDYSPSQDRIRYGDGGVDDSDDGEIVVHEYGHAIHNDIVPGFVYSGESGAISEGFGDYLGAALGNNALVRRVGRHGLQCRPAALPAPHRHHQALPRGHRG